MEEDTSEDEQMFDDLDLSKARKKEKEVPQFNIAIVCSQQDPASINVRDQLIMAHKFKQQKLKFDGNPIYNRDTIWLLTLTESALHHEHIDEQIEADLYIFASKHQSKEGVPALCLHAPGNWNKAEHGGSDQKLSMSSALFNKNAFKILKQNAVQNNLDLQVTLEATHHGPLLEKKPCFFIEIGSNEENWKNPKLGAFMAETIMKIADQLVKQALGKEKQNCSIAVGIGGTHYAQDFTKAQLEKNIAIAHIIPKYHLEYLNEDILKEAMQKTADKVDFFLVDWKGLGEHKEKVVSLIKVSGIPMKKTDE